VIVLCLGKIVGVLWDRVCAGELEYGMGLGE